MNYVFYYNIYIIIILFILIYYIIYNKIIFNNTIKEKFETSDTKNTTKKDNKGCFYLQQYNTNINSRDCQVYISKDGEEFCDKYEEYYKKSILELDDILNKLEYNNNSNDRKLKEAIIKIKDDIINNNITTCKLKYDGWREIKSYNDSKYEVNTSSNLIYPFKNIYNKPKNINDKLTNICFRNSSNNSINIFDKPNDSIIKSCDNVINNIYDKTNENNQHNVIRFENYNKYNLYNPLCLNKTDTKLDINDINIYLSIIANYNINTKELKTENISFVKYDKNNVNLFNKIENTDIIDIYNNLFKQIYNNNRILYCPKENNVNSTLIKYDICNNIENYITKNSKFNLEDFGIDNIKLLDINYSKYKELIEILNKDNKEYSIEEVKKIIYDLYNKNEKYLKEIKYKYNTYNDLDISSSSTVRIDSSLLPNDYSIYIDNINNYQIKTGNALNKLINKIFEIKEYIDEKYNDIKYEKNANSVYDEDVKNLNNYIIKSNEECVKLSQIYNSAINEELSITKTALDNINKMSIELIKNNYYNGLYYKINFHNSGIFTLKPPQNQLDFTSMYVNNKPNSIKNGKINYTNSEDYVNINNNYDNDNIYTVIEIDANVKFETGYYHFYIDLLNEEASEVYIGYNDKSTGKPNIIFKNVAHYYYSYALHPNERLRIPYGEGPATINNEANLTTKYPIYIDGSINGGYYGFYKRNVRHIGNIYNKLMNVYYSKVSTEQLKAIYNNKSYNIQTDDNFEYIRYVELNNNIKNSRIELKPQIYITKNVPEPSNFTLIDKYLEKNKTKEEEIDYNDYTYSESPNHLDYLEHWWKFDGDFKDSIGNKIFELNNSLQIKGAVKPYKFDKENIKSGSSSLKLKTNTVFNNVNNNEGSVIYYNDNIDEKERYLLSTDYNKYDLNYTKDENRTISLWINIDNKLGNTDIINIFNINLQIIGDNLCYSLNKCDNNEYKSIDFKKYKNKWNRFTFIYNKKNIGYSNYSYGIDFFINNKHMENISYHISGYYKIYIFKNISNDIKLKDTILYSDLRIYKKSLNIYEINDLCNIKNKEIYKIFKGHLNNLKYWWKFEDNLYDSIKNIPLLFENKKKEVKEKLFLEYNKNNIKNTVKSLEMLYVGNISTGYNLNTLIDIPDTFTLSLWINYNERDCELIKIGDEISLSVIQNKTTKIYENNKSITYNIKGGIYIKGISNKELVKKPQYYTSGYYSSSVGLNWLNNKVRKDSGNYNLCSETGGYKANETSTSSVAYGTESRQGGVYYRDGPTMLEIGNNYTYYFDCIKDTEIEEYSDLLELNNNKWNFYTITYNNNELSIYLNGVFKYKKSNILFNKNNRLLSLFNCDIKNLDYDKNKVLYCDLRIYDKILSKDEIEKLYGDDIEDIGENILRETNTITDEDTRLIKINDGYLINCPNMPSFDSMKLLQNINLLSFDFKNFIIPNIPRYSIASLIMVSNNIENLNLENFVRLKEQLLQVKEFRNNTLNISSYDCIIKNTNTSIKKSVNKDDYNDIKYILNDLNNDIDIYNNKQKLLMELLKDINNIEVYYDFNIILKKFKEGILVNPKYYELFYEDKKTKKYNMLLQI